MASIVSNDLREMGFPQEIVDEVSPFLLPENHIAFQSLKQLTPETLTLKNLREKGFYVWKQGGTVMLMIHEKLKGFVIKFPFSHLESEPRLGVTRVKGHCYANQYLNDQKVKEVKASKNWLFPVKCDPKAAESYEKFTQQKEELKKQKNYSSLKIEAKAIFMKSFLVVEERLELLSGSDKKRALDKLLNIKMLDILENFLLHVGESDIYLQNLEVTIFNELAFIDLASWKKDAEVRIQNGIIGFSCFYFISDNDTKKYWSNKTITLLLNKATDHTISKAMAVDFYKKETAHKSYVQTEIWQQLIKKISASDRELIE